MSEKSETVFRKKVVEDLKKFCRTVSFSIQQVSINGTPDLFCCINGRFVALELKADEHSKVSALQKYNIKKIEECGGIGFIVFPQNWAYVRSKLVMVAIGENLPEGFIK